MCGQSHPQTSHHIYFLRPFQSLQCNAQLSMLILVSAPQQMSLTLICQTSHNTYWTCIATPACVSKCSVCVRIDDVACLQTGRVLCTLFGMQQGECLDSVQHKKSTCGISSLYHEVLDDPMTLHGQCMLSMKSHNFVHSPLMLQESK